jgi:type IV pilus assembly protein PilM
MSSLAQLLQDPPPAHVFELSEAGIAYAKIAKTGGAPDVQMQRFEPGVITVSPVHDNVQRPDHLFSYIEGLAPANGNKKRRAALILPDYAARVAVLDFDSFPTNHEEQRALVRFRMKKSVPFDVDNAMVSYFPQARAVAKGSKYEVVVAVMANEIVGRYEEPFRTAGFHPGLVTTSSLSVLNLIEPDGVTLIVKLNGSNLTAIVLDGSIVKLVRCVEISEQSLEEVESVVLPTLAYIEDELASAPKRILLCGLGALGEQVSRAWANDWNVKIEAIASRFGTPGPVNAGLLGYLESVNS